MNTLNFKIKVKFNNNFSDELNLSFPNIITDVIEIRELKATIDSDGEILVTGDFSLQTAENVVSLIAKLDPVMSKIGDTLDMTIMDMPNGIEFHSLLNRGFTSAEITFDTSDISPDGQELINTFIKFSSGAKGFVTREEIEENSIKLIHMPIKSTKINYKNTNVTWEKLDQKIKDDLLARYGNENKAMMVLSNHYNKFEYITLFENHLTPDLIKELEDRNIEVVLFSGTALGDLSLHARKSLSFSAAGGCGSLDSGEPYLIFNLDYLVEELELEIPAIVKHELTHADQILSGRLILKDSGEKIWLGKPTNEYIEKMLDEDEQYRAEGVRDLSTELLIYCIQPWEMEAYAVSYRYMMDIEGFKGSKHHNQNEKAISKILLSAI